MNQFLVRIESDFSAGLGVSGVLQAGAGLKGEWSVCSGLAGVVSGDRGR